MGKEKLQHGFTLIELSIVLVIIGLIVGGVLVGQDLIRAAEIRATIGQIEKYNSAVNTFRGKYNGIPGDLQYQQANAFGLFAFSDGNAGGVGEGDGNGLIENPGSGGTDLPPPNGAASGGGGDIYDVGGEQFVFWRHLSEANLVDGNFGSGSNLDTGGNSTIATNDPSQFFPPAKVGRGMYFVVASDGVQNYFELGMLTSVGIGYQTWGTPLCGGGSCTFGLPPIDAYAIDTKIDDGMPNTGSVYAMFIDWKDQGLGYNGWWASPPVSGQGICITGPGPFDPTDTYNTNASTGGTEPACDMEFRFN